MSFKQAERMREVPMSKLRAIFYECIELEDEGMEVTALTLGEPDFDTPQYIKEACKEALDRGFTKYADNMGIPELREAVAQCSCYIKKQYKIKTDISTIPQKRYAIEKFITVWYTILYSGKPTQMSFVAIFLTI